MKSFGKEFFATRQDLLPGIRCLESEKALQYVQIGMFPSSTPTIFFSAMDIPNLGVSQHGDRIGENEFLVMDRGTDIFVEEIPQENGSVLYDVSILENPTAVAFRPCGKFRKKAIIAGSVQSALDESTSIAYCKWFWRALGKGFQKVGGYYYVGPEAYHLLEQGWRLTLATQCPSEFDLHVD